MYGNRETDLVIDDLQLIIGMKKILSTLLLSVTIGWLSAAFVGCSSDDSTETPVNPTPAQAVETVNVDVILPADIRKLWQPVIDMALENIEEAQKSLPARIELNLRYHDEEAADLEQTVYNLCFPKEGDDTCQLILGPYKSVKADMVLANAALRRVPVLMPEVTSDEIQRIQAANPYSWFFTESDATACENILNMSSASGIRNAALIYTDDRYGNSFRNWFGYVATEFSVNVDPDCIRPFSLGQDITDLLENIEREAQDEEKPYTVLFAVGSDEEYKQVISQALAARKRLFISQPSDSYVRYFVSDIGDTEAVRRAGLPLYGLSPAAATMSGFDTYFNSRFKSNPPKGAAQVYDALTLAALAAAKRAGSPSGPDYLILDGKKVEYRDAPYGPNLTDWMRALVADKTGETTVWTTDGLRKAFHLLSRGVQPNVTGATGQLLFDTKMHTSILQTTYWLWHTNGNGDYAPVISLSTHGDDGQVATLPTWEWQKTFSQDFNDYINVNHDLPEVEDHWALLVSPSTTWSNYRHQADVMAMYQLLRRHGYDDDHIVLVCEDNLANAPENVYSGKIYVESPSDNLNAEDVRKDVIVDYHFSDLQMDDIGRIILGDSDGGRLRHVMNTTAESDLFIFWSGHGADGRGMCWSDGSSSQVFTGERMRSILEELCNRNGYRRCMLAIETCFSGLIGEAIEGLPDVVAITAANKIEPSKADVHNRELGVFLSNAFARSFRKAIDENNNISLRDLFYQLARTTNGSHVTLYNDANYGSVYTLTARDFFPE
jgi:glycosylphosphatidylinositol transamidase (GPIT) subunit GPI8/ABC-type branched-subunit amino acid transport system substrate-binding protein